METGLQWQVSLFSAPFAGDLGPDLEEAAELFSLAAGALMKAGQITCHTIQLEFWVRAGPMYFKVSKKISNVCTKC